MIAAQISSLHVYEVHLDQKAKLVFPARNALELTGELAQTSADARTDPARKIPDYRAEITLSTEEAARIGQPLLPGMPVEALNRTGRAAPLPIWSSPSDYFTQAFRES